MNKYNLSLPVRAGRGLEEGGGHRAHRHLGCAVKGGRRIREGFPAL